MKKTTTILASLALGMAAATAGVSPAPAPTGKGVAAPPMDPCAGPISYNNVELLYASTDFDGGGDSGDGAILRVEHSLMENFYITASASYSDYDYGNTWLLTAGVGGYVPLSEHIHLAADAGIVYVDWEQDYYTAVKGTTVTRHTISDNDTGWYVRPHLRAKFGCLTMHAGAQYTDVSDSEDWSWFVNAYYQVAQAWDITAGYSDADEAQTWTAGVRWRY